MNPRSTQTERGSGRLCPAHARTPALFSVAAVLLLAWGALAFGAEFSWAYAPLLVFSVAVGLLGLIAGPAGAGALPSKALALALASVLIGAILQLLPVSRAAVAAVSPASVVTDYRQLYLKATMQPEEVAPPDAEALRPVSIAPSRTVLGLAFLAAFAILFVGSARGIGAVGPIWIARGVVALAVAMALVGMIHRANGAEAMYGFWYPRQQMTSFAPFFNRNHFAGWMVMALSLSVGLFAGALARGLRGVGRDWRSRTLWLSTPDAGEVLLTGSALAVMALSIVLTASRSGLLCLLSALAIAGWCVALRQRTRPRRIAGTIALASVLVVAVTRGGLGVVLERFAGGIDGRLSIWQDTLHIIQDSPLTGTGLNTYGVAMLHYQTSGIDTLYIEAHNDYLQLMAEGGLLLVVPALALLVLFTREVWRRFHERADEAPTYWLRVGAVTGLSAIALQEAVEFTLQMPGAAALFVVLAAIAVHRPARLRPDTTKTPTLAPVSSGGDRVSLRSQGR